jgi:hypothetical protein
MPSALNQANDSEKASQVRIIGDVYSNGKFSQIKNLGGMPLTLSLASEVWIWLWESADNSDLAMELVRRVANIDSEDPNLVPDPVAWSAFWSLMRRSWRKRVWILQDAFFAKKAIVNCGQIGVNIECFIHLNGVKTTYWRRIEPRLRPVLCVPVRAILCDSLGLISLQGVVRQRRNLVTGLALDDEWIRIEAEMRKDIGLIGNVHRSRPRDHPGRLRRKRRFA